MSTDLILKIKNANGDLQRVSSDEEKYLASVAGVRLLNYEFDVETVGNLVRGQNNLGYDFPSGSYADSKYNEVVGTHPESHITATTTTTNLDTLASSAVLNSTNKPYLRNWITTTADVNRPLVYKTINGKPSLQEIKDSDLNTLADRLNGLIAQHELTGVYRLDSAGFDPSETNWRRHVVGKFGSLDDRKIFATDNRTDGTSKNYHIWQKTGSFDIGQTDSCAIVALDRVLSGNDAGDLTNTPPTIKTLPLNQLGHVLGQRCKYRRGIEGNIGTYQLRSDLQGAPDATGTWKSVGSALDTRNTKEDQYHIHIRESVFSSTYVGTYTGEYTGGYNRMYAGDYIGDFILSFTGDFIKTYVGNYTAEYVGNYNRDVSTNFGGNYVGDYIDNYTGNYTGQYAGDYSGNFVRTFTGDYVNDIPKNFTAHRLTDYTKEYTGATFTANYTGDYTGNYVGNYASTSVKTYSGIDYTGNYASISSTKDSVFEFASTSVANYTSVTSTRARVEQYIGNYEKIRTGNFTGNYSRNFTGTYTGNYIITYTGNYTGNYHGNYTGNYTSTSTLTVAQTFTDNLVFTGLTTFSTRVSTRKAYPTTSQNWTRTRSGTPFSYTGNYQRIYVRYYPSAWSTAPIGGATGVSAPQYYGSRTRKRYGTAVEKTRDGTPTYVGNYHGRGVKQWLEYANTYIGGEYTKEIDYVGNFDTDYIGNFASVSVNYKTQGETVEGLLGGYSNPDSYGYNKLRKRSISVDINKDFTGNYTSVTRTNDFTGNFNSIVQKLREATFTGDFVQPFTGNYVGDYASTRTINYTGDFVGVYARPFVGNYTGNYNSTALETYIGTSTRDTDSIKNYTGNFARTFVGNFQSTRITDYISSAIYVSTRERSVNYASTSTSNILKDFVGDYTGNFISQHLYTSTRNYLLHRSVNYINEEASGINYTSTSTRERYEEFIGTYTGDYQRGYTQHRNVDYTGDYLGSTIRPTLSTHRTYTLYVRYN
jgi:hypothetical protein